MLTWEPKQQEPSEKIYIGAIMLIAFCSLFAFFVSCYKNVNAKPAVLAPGFVNQYDEDSFNGLITAQAAINQAKSEFGANPKAKAALNTAIKAYNDARVGYIAWHNAAVIQSGADHSHLDSLVSIMIGAIAAINQQFPLQANPVSFKSNFRLLYSLEAA